MSASFFSEFSISQESNMHKEEEMKEEIWDSLTEA